MKPFERGPKPRSSGALKRDQIHVATTPEEWNIVDEECEKLQMSKSSFIRMCIAEYLANKD